MSSIIQKIGVLLIGLASAGTFAQDSIDRRAQVQLDREAARLSPTAVVSVPSVQQSARKTPLVAPRADVTPPAPPPFVSVNVLSIVGADGALEAVLSINGQRVVANATSRGLPYGWRVQSISDACVQLVRMLEVKGGKHEEEIRVSCWVAPAPAAAVGQAASTARPTPAAQIQSASPMPLPAGVIGMPMPGASPAR